MSEVEHEIVGADDYDVDVDEGYDLFNEAGLYLYRNQEIRYLAVDGDRDVIGAIAVSADSLCITFSVVVDSRFRRQGVARALCEAVVDEAEEAGIEVHAEVVNIHMIPLLRSLGFVCEDDCGCESLTAEIAGSVNMYKRFK